MFPVLWLWYGIVGIVGGALNPACPSSSITLCITILFISTEKIVNGEPNTFILNEECLINIYPFHACVPCISPLPAVYLPKIYVVSIMSAID